MMHTAQMVNMVERTDQHNRLQTIIGLVRTAVVLSCIQSFFLGERGTIQETKNKMLIHVLWNSYAVLLFI